MAGGHALVHGLDRCQVFLQIASGVEEGFHARLLLLIVDISDEDGNLGSQCDIVESLFPNLCTFACAFRRDGQLHPALCVEASYHLVGFTVGVVDKKDIITGENLKAGDVLIGMASSGVHSNGFSLVRKIFKMDRETLNTYVDELGKTLGEALLAPTRIYVGAMKSIKNAGVRVKACSHITGGAGYPVARRANRPSAPVNVLIFGPVKV